MFDKHIKRLAKLNTTECLWIYILKILSEKPSHAYVLRKTIDKRFGFMPGTVTAYKVLYDLQRMRLVTKKKIKNKKVYQITEKGRADLERAIFIYKKLAEDLES